MEDVSPCSCSLFVGPGPTLAASSSKEHKIGSNIFFHVPMYFAHGVFGKNIEKERKGFIPDLRLGQRTGPVVLGLGSSLGHDLFDQIDPQTS